MFELKELTVSYQDQPLFDPLTCVFEQSQLSLIKGINGVGKSTLLRAMLKLHPPLSGSITLNNQLIQTYQRYQVGRLIGYVHQQPAYQLFGMSVLQECELFHQFRQQAVDYQAIDHYLDQLQLSHLKQQHPQLCSRGEQQRLALVIALLQKPTMILLDEPTTALDDFHVQAMMELIKQHPHIGWVMVSHDERLSALSIDQTIVLKRALP